MLNCYYPESHKCNGECKWNNPDCPFAKFQRKEIFYPSKELMKGYIEYLEECEKQQIEFSEKFCEDPIVKKAMIDFCQNINIHQTRINKMEILEKKLDFSETLKYLKDEHFVKRKKWNNKYLFIKNKKIIQNDSGEISLWHPTSEDIMAKDWIIYKQ